MTTESKPKTETTSDKHKQTSHDAAHGFGGFSFGPDAFAAMTREHFTRVETWMKEMAAAEDVMLARAKANAAQVAQLAQDSMDYMAQLSAEWRKIMLDVARRAADVTLPKA